MDKEKILKCALEIEDAALELHGNTRKAYSVFWDTFEKWAFKHELTLDNNPTVSFIFSRIEKAYEELR